MTSFLSEKFTRKNGNIEVIRIFKPISKLKKKKKIRICEGGFFFLPLPPSVSKFLKIFNYIPLTRNSTWMEEDYPP